MADLHVDMLGDIAPWAFVELGQTQLGDPRRTERLLHVASALARSPNCPVPEACQSWAQTKGAYRFFDNDDIEPEIILHGHYQSTVQRLGEYPMVLAIQDTSHYNFTTHRATRGLGRISGKLGELQPMGFLVHSCLAATLDGVPLGLLGHKLWVRSEAEGVMAGEQESPRSGKDIAKESLCWEELLTTISQRVPAGTKLLTVGDRGADIYDFFVAAIRLNQDVLVRSAHNRQLVSEGKLLWDLVQQVQVVGHLVIEVPRGDDRPSRTATLELRATRVRLRRPSHARTQQAVRVVVSAVLAREIDPPDGQEPISWQLLTTLPVTTAEEAANCVRWYSKRWTIERYHYTLKSGCQIEELQLESVDRLHRALAVYSVVAWRLMYLAYMARTTPERPCTLFLSSSEWRALYCHTKRTKKLPESPPDLKTAVLWIAKLGGFLARKRDGNPGVKVLWRGYRRLQDAVVIWDVLQPEY